MDSDDSYHNKPSMSSPSSNQHNKAIPPPPSMMTPPNIAPPQRNNSTDQLNKLKAKSPGNKNKRVDALADWDPFFESDD